MQLICKKHIAIQATTDPKISGCNIRASTLSCMLYLYKIEIEHKWNKKNDWKKGKRSQFFQENDCDCKSELSPSFTILSFSGLQEQGAPSPAHESGREERHIGHMTGLAYLALGCLPQNLKRKNLSQLYLRT